MCSIPGLRHVPGGRFREATCRGSPKSTAYMYRGEQIKEPKPAPFPHGASMLVAQVAKEVSWKWPGLLWIAFGPHFSSSEAFESSQIPGAVFESNRLERVTGGDLFGDEDIVTGSQKGYGGKKKKKEICMAKSTGSGAGLPGFPILTLPLTTCVSLGRSLPHCASV